MADAAGSSTRRGVLAAGNFIVDQVKLIDVYPHPEQLANIHAQSQGTGGAPYNVLINLAKLGVSLPLFAAGAIGRDALGEWILADCQAHGIDTRGLQVLPGATTSYTDVMTERNGGRRTFFHHRGANAAWDGRDLEFGGIPARIFHLGYLLLLDALDAPHDTLGTQATRLLAAAQAAGLKTSVDVVSEESDRFSAIVRPALPFVDYCIVNEIEAGKTCGIRVRTAAGDLDPAALRRSARDLLEYGVRELVVIHFPEGAYARARSGEDLYQPSLAVEAGDIAGTAGAGDAFCAGVLLGLHEGWELSRCLETGVCVAAASLAHPTCTGGVVPLERAMALLPRHGLRAILE
ncbi:MAG TPA: carbohydrate kinase family protein [Pirellulaceae bacterium]